MPTHPTAPPRPRHLGPRRLGPPLLLLVVLAVAPALDAAGPSERGPDDFPVSEHPTPAVDASAAVAYNSARHEYLVVWGGSDPGGVTTSEHEIFGQRIDAATGAQLGTDDFRISDMGPDLDPGFGAADPAVAYNSERDEYLVVWSGADDAGDLVPGEFEIYGQRLVYDGGGNLVPIGVNDFRISDVGPDGSPQFDAGNPAVAYNGASDEYLVVWDADDTGTDQEFEIYGQRLAYTLASLLVPAGTNDFRISAMGPNGNPAFQASEPDVAHDPLADRFLVVWSSDDDGGGVVDNENEIYGQLLDDDGAPVGVDDFRISFMGAAGDTAFDATHPAVAFNPDALAWLVVWSADHDAGGQVDNELEIFGQLLDATTAGTIGGLLRVSDAGGTGDPAFDAQIPAVDYSPTQEAFLVAWNGDDNRGGLTDQDFRIFFQALDGGDGSERGENDPAVGANGTSFLLPIGIAADAADGRGLIVWPPDPDYEQRTRAQLVVAGLFADGFEGGDTSAWSDVAP